MKKQLYGMKPAASGETQKEIKKERRRERRNDGGMEGRKRGKEKKKGEGLEQAWWFGS